MKLIFMLSGLFRFYCYERFSKMALCNVVFSYELILTRSIDSKNTTLLIKFFNLLR